MCYCTFVTSFFKFSDEGNTIGGDFDLPAVTDQTRRCRQVAVVLDKRVVEKLHTLDRKLLAFGAKLTLTISFIRQYTKKPSMLIELLVMTSYKPLK